MKQKEFLLIALLYIIVAITAFFCYKKMFGDDGGNQDGNTDPGKDTPGTNNEVIKVGTRVQCVGKVALRSSAEIDDGLIDNIIKKDAKGSLGEVVGKSTDAEGNVWCKIKLDDPVYEWLISHDEVYVLEADITKM